MGPIPRAYIFLREKMEQYDDKYPPNVATVASLKAEFDRLLDADMSTATTPEQRHKLKALGVGGGHAFDRMLGAGSHTTLGTFSDLVALATGERGSTSLAPAKPRRSQRSAQQDWELSRAIVALKKGYDRYSEFKPWLRKITGKSGKEIRKIIDNMDQERGPYETIRTNIKDIERRFKRGEDWLFDDLQSP